MSEEEYIRNRLDRFIKNGTYGLMDNEKFDRLTREACNDLAMIWNVDYSEIDKIVHDYIEAADKLILKEDNKMKATSKQEIKNIRDISFSFLSCPVEMKSELTITATTDDDIFEFVFEGEHIIQGCEKSGMFIGWEKDQKIRELEEELGRWKKEAADCLRLRDEAQKEAYKLKKENEKYEEKIKKLEHDDMLDKNAADYWSKEHDILLVRFAKLQVKNESNKENLNSQHEMIKELNQKNLKLQEEYESLKNSNKSCISSKMINRVHELEGLNKQLSDRILELEELKTPTIENFADEEPSTRADILDQAKKCVCGQRERDYGTPESNFQLIADLWNDYLGLCENGDGEPIFSIKSITPKDVAMMMALMKIARIRNGGGSGDSFVDLAGYAACGGEIWHGRKA